MIRRPPRSTLDRSSAASDVYKRQGRYLWNSGTFFFPARRILDELRVQLPALSAILDELSLIHISEPTRPY